jgi:autotransporter translocation and assembly factor TamB
VQAGSVKASGRLAGGDSRITCDAGNVNLNLEPGSSVRIKAHTTIGKVELPGQVRINGRGIAEDVTIGDATGSLVIEANMGSVRVTAA